MILFLFPWKIWDVPESGNTPNMLLGQRLCWLSTGCGCAAAPKTFFGTQMYECHCVNKRNIKPSDMTSIFKKVHHLVSYFLFNGVTFIQCPNIFRAAVREHELKLDDSCPCATSNVWQCKTRHCNEKPYWEYCRNVIFLTRRLLVLFRRTRQCQTRTPGRASTRHVNIRTTPQWMY